MAGSPKLEVRSKFTFCFELPASKHKIYRKEALKCITLKTNETINEKITTLTI